jgi:p21-activated kinase 1
MSQRTPQRVPSPYKELDRSASQRNSPTPSASRANHHPPPHLVPTRAPPQRPVRPPAADAPGAPASGSAAAQSPSVSPSQSNQGPGDVPRRRHKPTEGDVVEKLRTICTDADPAKLYRNLVKIGQGCVLRWLFFCVFVRSNLRVFVTERREVSILLIKSARTWLWRSSR